MEMAREIWREIKREEDGEIRDRDMKGYLQMG
jgi:hypothetical protein